MALFASLIQTLLPNLTATVARELLSDLKEFARSQIVEIVVMQAARVVTKGIDGLVKVFARRLDAPDAHTLTHGVLDEFHRQVMQLAESLRTYAAAAYEVEAAKVRGDVPAQIDKLRNARAALQKDVEGEFHDTFSVLTGGTPED